MKRFFLPLLLFLSPFILLFVTYIYLDPFGVIYKFDQFLRTADTKSLVSQLVTGNSDFEATETFFYNYDKCKFNSFIFGNSCSKDYFIQDWRKHINDTACFHWDASNESIWGIERKLNYLDERHLELKNVLIVLGKASFSVVSDAEEHLYVKDYRLTGRSYLKFQKIFFIDFTDVNFMKVYLPFVFFGHVNKKEIDGRIFAGNQVKWDKTNNEMSYYWLDQQLAADADKFYAEKEKKFPQPLSKDSLTFSPQSIREPQFAVLNKIALIIKKHNATCKLVISPCYDQIKFDTTDLKTLKSIFGGNNVFDFTGANKITKNKYNFYDGVHYLPFMNSRIMNVIYSASPEDSLNSLLQ